MNKKGDAHEQFDDIIDEIERRLLEDARMPERNDGFSISPPEVRRGERFERDLQTYPATHIIYGEVEEVDEDTSRRNTMTVTVWLETYIRERDPEIATELIKDHVMAQRRLFRENPEDKQLTFNGAALARNVHTPTYDWGAFRNIGRGEQWEFGGLVELRITYSVPR